MLISLILIILLGWLGGQLASKIGAPSLIGMILAGILLSPQISNLLAPSILDVSDELRSLAVMVILLRAGLGLDKEKLIQQSSVAIRLGFLPALSEAFVVAFVATWLFEFNLITGLLLGCVVAAESPAVIVPGMLRLKSLGWGVAKGIPDAILTGSALSDVLVLLLFSLLLNFLAEDTTSSIAIWLLPLKVMVQIILGVIIGYITAHAIVFVAVKKQWTKNSIHNTLVTACTALIIIYLAEKYLYFSGYLATMAMGFFLINLDPPIARQLRIEFNNLWVVAEIILFVLMGASIQLQILENVLIKGVILLVIGLLLGRTIGWYFSTLGSDWNWRERLFLLPGNSAKATVQAAIGAIPLSKGIIGGDIILAIAALSILTTAPLGAWAIPTFAPKLLTKNNIDPTKVIVTRKTIFLAILEENTATKVLKTAADFARRSNGEVIVVGVTTNKAIKREISSLLLDIRYQCIEDNIPTFGEVTAYHEANLLAIAENNNVTNIIIGNFGTAELLRNQSNIPVTVV